MIGSVSTDRPTGWHRPVASVLFVWGHKLVMIRAVRT